MPITDIGEALGFSEPGGFSRAFVAWARMTPSAYRTTYVADATKVAAATALLNERRIA
jgi:AraC-type DNA-binding domain-containing proteins